jgi:hypothetical protein
MHHVMELGKNNPRRNIMQPRRMGTMEEKLNLAKSLDLQTRISMTFLEIFIYRESWMMLK